MTNEEAIWTLENGAWWDHLPDDMSDADKNPLLAALDVAVSAMREHVEKLGEPLTLNELREMDGKPVRVVYDEAAKETTPGFEPLEMLALVEVRKSLVFLTNNLGGRTYYRTDNDLIEEGITVYEYRPASVDFATVMDVGGNLEALEPCETCKTHSCSNCLYDNLSMTVEPCFSCVGDKWEAKYRFCPDCGLPITPEACAVFEKRLRG